MEIVIYGQPRTKKNSSRIALINNKRVLLPSEAYERYEKVALVQLARVQAVYGPLFFTKPQKLARFGRPIASNLRHIASSWRD